MAPIDRPSPSLTDNRCVEAVLYRLPLYRWGGGQLDEARAAGAGRHRIRDSTGDRLLTR